MWWLEHLYLGESVRDKEKEIKRKLRTNAGITGVHILALSLQPEEQIDIFPAQLLKQRAFPKDELYIFGFAGGKAEALAMVTGICQETLDATGDADMRSFLGAMSYRRSRGIT